MKILVTGGAGYIGSVTVEFLRGKGQEVVVVDDLFRGHRATLDSSVPFYQGKIGDRALLKRITSEHKIDACIHFAALAYVGESVTEPEKYFENNVEQGVALLSALREAGVANVVLSSTCATYGEVEKVPISEQTPQWPANPYGWSKLAMERVLDAYDRAYGLKFAALRYFNAAGATKKLGEYHQPESHLIPNVLAAAAGENSEVSVFGNSYPTPDGTAIRDYVHVTDLAAAHVLALDHLRNKRESIFMNLGTGHGYSVLEVIETARQVTGRPISVRFAPPRPGDPPKLVADATRARTVLGWKPTMSDLTTILRTQWEWRQAHPRGYPA
jgi:UDP-glucose 4-epimerase